MPLLKLKLSCPVDAEKKGSVLSDLSQLTARGLGKPEKYVMVTMDEGEIVFAGENGPAAFADVRGIGGFNRITNQGFAKLLCTYLSETLGIDPQRVYITFTDIEAVNWGWNGSTFG
jgi:phenylpyruvate tautomerase